MRLALLVLAFACQGRDADRAAAPMPSPVRAATPAIDAVVVPPPRVERRPEKLPATPEFKQLQVEIALARIDPAIHGLRVEWTNDPHRQWPWPIYLEAKDAEPSFTALLALADQAPAVPQLDDAVRAYVQHMRAHFALLSRYVHGWAAAELQDGAEKASAPQVIELLEQIGVTSHALRDVLRQTPAPPPSPPSSRLAMVRACVAAIESIAYTPGVVLAERPPTPTVYKSQPFAEFATKARACTVAAMDYLEYEHGDGYEAGLGLSIGARTFREIAEQRRGKPYGSSAVQTMMYLAARITP